MADVKSIPKSCGPISMSPMVVLLIPAPCGFFRSRASTAVYPLLYHFVAVVIPKHEVVGRIQGLELVEELTLGDRRALASPMTDLVLRGEIAGDSAGLLLRGKIAADSAGQLSG